MNALKWTSLAVSVIALAFIVWAARDTARSNRRVQAANRQTQAAIRRTWATISLTQIQMARTEWLRRQRQ